MIAFVQGLHRKYFLIEKYAVARSSEAMTCEIQKASFVRLLVSTSEGLSSTLKVSVMHKGLSQIEVRLEDSFLLVEEKLDTSPSIYSKCMCVPLSEVANMSLTLRAGDIDDLDIPLTVPISFQSIRTWKNQWKLNWRL